MLQSQENSFSTNCVLIIIIILVFLFNKPKIYTLVCSQFESFLVYHHLRYGNDDIPCYLIFYQE